MKRTAIMVLTLIGIFAVSAFAQYGIGGYNPGYGHGYGHGRGMHGCMGYALDTAVRPGAPSGEIVINNDAEARAAVDKVISESFKGYKIVDSVAFDTPRGTKAYHIYVKDASDNDFTFMVHSFGGVRGPVAGKVTPMMPMAR